MQRNAFEALVNAQLGHVQTTLLEKSEEYASEGDVLAAFRTAAIMQNATLREALGGMMAKHTASIYKMINDWECGPLDIWAEKITDHINYLLILKAIVTEELQTKSEAEQPALTNFHPTPVYDELHYTDKA